jgi:hypothetical protein
MFEKISESEVEITITLSGWSFSEEGMYNVMVNGYSSTSELESNPSPGQFPHKFDAGASPYTFTVPLATFYGVHAVVVEN